MTECSGVETPIFTYQSDINRATEQTRATEDIAALTATLERVLNRILDPREKPTPQTRLIGFMGRTLLPRAYKELLGIKDTLENHFKEMQDIEFTVERGKLWMLQTRGGKRTAKAALRIAVELANEGLISKKDAVLRIDPASLDPMEQRRREFLNSMLTVLIFSVNGAVIFALARAGVVCCATSEGGRRSMGASGSFTPPARCAGPDAAPEGVFALAALNEFS